MYLATQPYNDLSFEEWKEKVYKNTAEKFYKKRTTQMSKLEIDATINKANQILKGFKPPRERR